ncbi:MAG: CIA30 family protein [Cyanobacteria bacterium]|nr:CIA30 family protein [Cyanobacteriota bacterium]MDW8202865.1 CIA30 family protein [Cyanobacteriota bacterium SKYGB_h_bin112]
MTEKSSAPWDFGRFLKTVAYFGEVPLLSKLDWFQHLMGSRVEPRLDAAALASTEANLLVDFTQPIANLSDHWGALDDVVMGGASQSQLIQQDGVALFTGILSTANSGGFASVRTRNIDPPLDLSAAMGIQLQVKGDGKRYKFMVRSQTQWDGIAYCYSFDTIAEQWITVQIPFAAMIPVFRARTLNSAEPLNTRQICSLQLMLSKFEYDGALNPHFAPGRFCLAVKTIATYQ